MNTSSDDDQSIFIKEKNGLVSRNVAAKFNDVAIFIQEIYRLIPFIQGSFLKFHALNMPHIIVGQVKIVGIILNIVQKKNCYDLTVPFDDGTGAITVMYKIKNFKIEQHEREGIDEKHKRLARVALLSEKWLQHDSTIEPLPLSFPKVRPSIEYDSKIPYLEHK